MSNFFNRFVLPGLVFQSVIIGGGYGTGREIAEFFVSHGPLSGLLGLGVTAAAWSLTLAVAFEFARISEGYNYRAFFKALIGPFWRVFEILYLLIALLILSVLGSASGEMISQALGAPPVIGVLLLLGAVGVFASLGGKMIERSLAAWSFVLYVVYGIFFIWVVSRFGGTITGVLSEGLSGGAWLVDGVRYAAYNLIALAAVLFVLPYLRTRREALISGAAAGLIGILPGVAVFLAMLSQYPAIQDQPVPVLSVLQALNSIWFFAVFQIVLFGTFIETGLGIIHAVNERLAAAFADRGRAYPGWARFALAAALLCIATFLARSIGIIDLIAKGYGVLSYGFIAIVVAPLLTFGIYKIITEKSSIPEASSELR